MRTAEAGSGTDPSTIAAFLVMVVAVGGNVIGIKYIARAGELDPLWAAASRFLLAAAIFAIAARAMRAPLPRGRAFVGAVLYGTLSIGAFFGLAYWGLQRAPAGLAGVFLATGPLLTFLFALAHRQEQFSWDSMIGAIIVVAGTAIVYNAGRDEGVPAASLLAILAASACAAEGAIVVKGFPPVHPAMRNTIGMAVGAAFLLVLMPFFDESVSIPNTATTWAAQVYLVLIGSVAVFALYLFILSRWTASSASYEFVLAPIVGVVLAVWLLDEQVSGRFIAGSVVVLAGVYLGAIRPARAKHPRRAGE